MNPDNSSKKAFGLFLSTFASAALVLAGIAGLILMLAPTLAHFWQSTADYVPQLPIALAREEEFLNPHDFLGKQLFPPLGLVDNVQTGNWIRIPSIGVNVPILMSPSLQDDDVLKTLDEGAALYPNGILPGRLGNTFISAHSTAAPWQGKYRFAFLRINEVKPGNVVHVDYEGTRYTYRVTHKEIITPTPEYRVVSDRPVPTLTVMSCWPLWTSTKRDMTTGILVNVTKLTPRPV